VSDTRSYDIIIIGSGPGGYCAAIRAAQLGMRAAVIEKSAALGGTCLNIGCIPSKALLESSERFAQAKGGLVSHGIIVDAVRLDLAAMMARKDKVVATLSRGVGSLLQRNGVTVIHGSARFAGNREVDVEQQGSVARFSATRAILIATGSVPSPLPPVPFDGRLVVDSTGALSFPEVPRRLVVVGGGAIGVELASVWARLGAEVSIIEMKPQLLPGSDSQSARLLERLLRAQGIGVFVESGVVDSKKQGDEVRLTVRGKTGGSEIAADRVLVAIGRRPDFAGLSLDKAGIATDAKTGRLPIDRSYMTACPGVYAIGDAVAGPMLAHKASAEGVAAVERIAGLAASVNYNAIPSVVYASPEVASVGFTDANLIADHTDFRTGIFNFRANGRALAADAADGFVKVLCHAGTDRILGVQVVGANASEIIAQAVVAIEFGGSAEDLGLMTYAHPTLSEAVKEACLDVEKKSIHAMPPGREAPPRAGTPGGRQTGTNAKEV
jgi:dihydrolipoamide dehydrogenase